jgi:uncharacterized protein (TIGR04255 family)
MAKSPIKLKKDGIVEALFEVRFATPAIPEMVVGQLVGDIAAMAPQMALERTPLADLPAPMRRADPNLAYQATLQLRSADGLRIGRVGDNVVSWHMLAPYAGWAVFRPEIEQLVERVKRSINDLSIVRAGFRYLNFLNATDHLVGGIKDLTLDVTIKGKVIDYPINVNYHRDFRDHRITTKIATPEFIQPRPPDVSLYIDVDVHTEDRPSPHVDELLPWVDRAHDLLKDEFFTLIKPEILKELVEE